MDVIVITDSFGTYQDVVVGLDLYVRLWAEKHQAEHGIMGIIAIEDGFLSIGKHIFELHYKSL